MRPGNRSGARFFWRRGQLAVEFPVSSLLLHFPLAAHAAELLDPIERSLIFSPVKKNLLPLAGTGGLTSTSTLLCNITRRIRWSNSYEPSL
jgi:hypothetical protein